MLYFSEITKKHYNTEKECLEAEAAAKEAKKEIAKDRQAVEEVLEEWYSLGDEWIKKYDELLKTADIFRKKYPKEILTISTNEYMDWMNAICKHICFS